MTKEQANEIKKVLKKNADFYYRPYFNSKKNELRIELVCWQTTVAPIDMKFVNDKMIKVLNILSNNGLRPKYHKDQIIYQGTLDCRYIVFE